MKAEQPRESLPVANSGGPRGRSSTVAETSQALLMPEPVPLHAPAQSEFTPLTDLQSFIPVWLRDAQPDSVLLETRGTTSHLKQPELWAKNLIYKEPLLAKLMEIGGRDLPPPSKQFHPYQPIPQSRHS